MSFCSDADICQNKHDCRSWYSDAEQARAIRWWGNENVPVAFMSLKDTCKDFKEVQK